MVGPKKQGIWPKINCNQIKLPKFVNPATDSSSKIGHDFSNTVDQNLKLSKNNFNKNVLLNYVVHLKKIKKIRMIFDIENSL